jgi:prepilin-type N-terminal cleavage/methylation domain-containing protein
VLRRADEEGFTLVELAVAMSILLLVAGALLAALDSGTSAEHHASNRIDSEQSANLVLAQFARDVRNASGVMRAARNTAPDAQTTLGSPQVTSPSAGFTGLDAGQLISDSLSPTPYIPAGAFIVAVESTTTVLISADATGTGTTQQLTIGAPFTVNQIDLLEGAAHIRWWYNVNGHVFVRKVFQGSSANNGVSISGVTNPTGTVFSVFSADGTELLTLPDRSRGDIGACAASIEASVTANPPAPSAPFTVSMSAPLHINRDQRGCP